MKLVQKLSAKVELRVPGVPVPVIGYIDLILEDGTPADLKTSKSSWPEAKATDSLQGLFYLAALNQAGMKTSGKFTHLIFVKTKEPKVQVLENTHGTKELFFLFEIITAGMAFHRNRELPDQSHWLVMR